jgi:hypothetical protein
MNSLLSLDLVNIGVDGWMDEWIMCEHETLFSLGSSFLANQSGQLGLVKAIKSILVFKEQNFVKENT